MAQKMSLISINAIYEGLERAGQPMDKPHTQNLIRTLQKGGQHKEATDIFNKAYKDNSPAARNSLARRLGIEETAKPNKVLKKQRNLIKLKVPVHAPPPSLLILGVQLRLVVVVLVVRGVGN